MVGEDTHLTRLGGDVDLDDVLRLEDGLVRWLAFGAINSRSGGLMLRSSRRNGLGEGHWVAMPCLIGSSGAPETIRGDEIIPGEAETGSA